MESTSRFVPSGTQFRRIVSVLDRAPAISYVLDSELRFIYCNPAWDRFALENGAPELAEGSAIGTELFTVVPEVLTQFYSRIFEEVRRNKLVWSHVYECSSPEQFRSFRMLIHLLASQCLLVTNTLVVERPHEVIVEGNADVYVARGIVCMCAHCRCSQRRDKPEQWDFVPEHFKIRPPGVSHGLCPVCRAYFYPSK